MNQKSAIIALLVLFFLTACGQKGGLYLPKENPPPSMEKTHQSDKKDNEE